MFFAASACGKSAFDQQLLASMIVYQSWNIQDHVRHVNVFACPSDANSGQRLDGFDWSCRCIPGDGRHSFLTDMLCKALLAISGKLDVHTMAFLEWCSHVAGWQAEHSN